MADGDNENIRAPVRAFASFRAVRGAGEDSGKVFIGMLHHDRRDGPCFERRAAPDDSKARSTDWDERASLPGAIEESWRSAVVPGGT